jgi:tRNA threonylcarbamoyladenosine biosynthesis protein TsaB
VGPGSFTGIRIGLAAALGIHSATGTPAAGVGCLDIAARACYDATSPTVGSYIVCAADVRRGEVVLAGFRVEGDGPVRLDGDRLTATAQAGPAPEGATLVGDGAMLLWPEASLSRWAPTGAQRAVAVARMGVEAWARGEAEPPAPRYARGADARPRVR